MENKSKSKYVMTTLQESNIIRAITEIVADIFNVLFWSPAPVELRWQPLPWRVTYSWSITQDACSEFKLHIFRLNQQLGYYQQIYWYYRFNSQVKILLNYFTNKKNSFFIIISYWGFSYNIYISQKGLLIISLSTNIKPNWGFWS